MARLEEAMEQLRAGGAVLILEGEERFDAEGLVALAAEHLSDEAAHSLEAQAQSRLYLACVRDAETRSDVTLAEGLASAQPASSAERAAAVRRALAARDVLNSSAEAGLMVAYGEPGGVLARRRPLEGALDLMRLSGLTGPAALFTVNTKAGRAARLDELVALAQTRGLPRITLAEIADYRVDHEVLVEEIASANLPSAYSPAGLRARAFRSLIDGLEHLALVKGEPREGALVRVHSECLTGDVLGSLRCDCGDQLRAALAQIGASQSGALIYVHGHEGRGIGLANKIAAYALQDQGLDTAQANAALGFAQDTRDYAAAVQILRAIGLTDIRLLSNNPRKSKALRRHGIRVREELPLVLKSNPHNAAYLAAKRDKLGHRLPAAVSDQTAA